jgi:hypothetical protein
LLMDDAPAGTKIEIKAGKAAGVTITLNVTPQPSLAIQVGGGNTINVSDTGVTMTAAGSLAITMGAAATVTVGGSASVTVAGAASITAGGAVNVTAGGAVNLTAGALNVTSGIANFAGVVTASAIVTNSVVSPLYTPGIGNLV